jgi:hypothetical protein
MDSISLLLPGIRLVIDSELELLGSPILPEGIIPHIDRKLSQLNNLCKRVIFNSSHVAFLLLRSSIGFQRIIYLLRTAPTFLELQSLECFDQVIRDTLEKVFNLSIHEQAWQQLSLPIKSGGLGIRSCVELSLPCYISSIYSSDAIIDTLCSIPLQTSSTDPALVLWDEGQINRPPLDKCHIQHEWDDIVTSQRMSILINEATSDVDKIRLEGAREESSGWWIQALPSKLVGTHLSDDQIRIAIGQRLGLDICVEQTCGCGDEVDRSGLHYLSCIHSSKQRDGRHSAVNDVISRALRQAGFPNTLEPPNLARDDDGIRPDGVTHMPWMRGQCLIWDATVRDSYALGYRSLALSGPGKVAQRGDYQKERHYASLSDYVFFPFSIETSGVWSPKAVELIKRVGNIIQIKSGESRATAFVKQRISIEVMRGSALMVLQGMPYGRDLEELQDL